MKYTRLTAFMVLITILMLYLSNPANAQGPMSTFPPEQHVIYFDDFEHGSNNWSLEKGWYLLNDGNNTYLEGNLNYPSKAWFLVGGWDNYTIKAKFRLIQGSFYFVYRMQDRGDCYWIYIDKNLLSMKREISTDLYRWELANSTLALDDNWHEIEISGYGNAIRISIDNSQKIFYIDTDRPNLDGYFTIDQGDSTNVLIDDVEILGWPDTHPAYTMPYWGYLMDVSGKYLFDTNPPGMGMITIPSIIILFLAIIGLVVYISRRRKEKRQITIQSSNSQGLIGNIRKKLSFKNKKTSTDQKSIKPEELVDKMIRHDVFISYSHEDKSIADAMCNNLESKGIRCWVAPRDVRPGANFQEAIIDAIATSKIMVLIFTARSNDSPHVIRELTKAVSSKVMIIPFKVEDVPLSKSMDYLISVPHWLDAMTPPLEKHIEELARVIESIIKDKNTRMVSPNANKDTTGAFR